MHGNQSRVGGEQGQHSRGYKDHHKEEFLALSGESEQQHTQHRGHSHRVPLGDVENTGTGNDN